MATTSEYRTRRPAHLVRSTPAVRAAAEAFWRVQDAATGDATMIPMDEPAEPEAPLPLLPMVRLLTEDAVSVRRNTATGEPEVLMRAGGGEFDALPLADAIELGVAMLIEQELPLFDD